MPGSYFIGMLYILLNSTTFSKVLGQSQSLEYFLSVPPCVFPRIVCCWSYYFSPFHSPALSSWMGDHLGLQPRLLITNGRKGEHTPFFFFLSGWCNAAKHLLLRIQLHSSLITDCLQVRQLCSHREIDSFLSGCWVEKTCVHTFTILSFLVGRKNASAS